MTIEAQYLQNGDMIDWTADAAYVAGQVIQLRDGRAGVVSVDVASGDKVGVYVDGIFKVQKTATMVMLIGTQLHWDHSANKAHLLHANDRDFYLGMVAGGATIGSDAASADTTVLVDLNKKPVYVSSFEHGYASLPVSTAGFTNVQGCGGGYVQANFDLTAEAQKLDALALRGFAPAAIPIVDCYICINVEADAASGDMNFGIANGTHASSFDSVSEYLAVHIDGGSTNIALQSTDGTTTVASTDTTKDLTAGTMFLMQFDLRDLSDIQCYHNGVLVLTGSVFKLNAATGPLKAIMHIEKDANDTPGNVTAFVGARTAQV